MGSPQYLSSTSRSPTKEEDSRSTKNSECQQGATHCCEPGWFRLEVWPLVLVGDGAHDVFSEGARVVTVCHDDCAITAVVSHEIGFVSLVTAAMVDRLTLSPPRAGPRPCSRIPGIGVSIWRVIVAESTDDFPARARCTSTTYRARSDGVVHNPAGAISG